MSIIDIHGSTEIGGRIKGGLEHIDPLDPVEAELTKWDDGFGPLLDQYLSTRYGEADSGLPAKEPESRGRDDNSAIYPKDIPLLTASQEVELAKRYEKGDDSALEKMFLANTRLVKYIAWQYLNNGVEYDDLIQEGSMGLMRAIQKYDWRKGYRFSTYATYWIKQSMSRANANYGRTIRVPVDVNDRIIQLKKAESRLNTAGIPIDDDSMITELGWDVKDYIKAKLARETTDTMISLSRPLSYDSEPNTIGDTIADSQADIVAETEAKFFRADIEEALGRLSEAERKVITLRFGLDDNERRAIETIAIELNISKVEVRKLEKNALTKLAGCSNILGYRERQDDAINRRNLLKSVGEGLKDNVPKKPELPPLIGAITLNEAQKSWDLKEQGVTFSEPVGLGNMPQEFWWRADGIARFGEQALGEDF